MLVIVLCRPQNWRGRIWDEMQGNKCNKAQMGQKGLDEHRARSGRWVVWFLDHLVC